MSRFARLQMKKQLSEERMAKPLALTTHAKLRLATRQIALEWIQQTVYFPDWLEIDPNDSTVERRFSAIPEFGDRILRVACVETETTIRVITAVFDRKARRKP